MAIASIKTKLPLTTWAKYMGMHPLHFEQVRVGGQDPHCDHIYFQHSWQTADHVSREEIAQAIADAESKIENYLGYRIAPAWEVDEWKQTIRPYDTRFVNYNNSDVRGFMQTVRANWGYMISGGREAKDLVDAGASIAYSDVDGDGYKERAVITATVTFNDPSEVEIYYPGHGGEKEWQIRPIEVVISGANATITLKRELLVAEELLNVHDIEGAEAIGTDDTDFLEEVDVYRHYNDPQTQASFLWEPAAGGYCGTCGGTGCSLCSYTTQTGCLILRGEPRQSIVGYHPAEWNATDLEFNSVTWAVNRQPDIARLYYYAGWRDKSLRYTNRMDTEWERVVAYMAAAMLDRPPCDCSKGDWSRWRQDFALQAGSEDGQAFFRELGGLFGKSILDNPFGTRRGEIYAWRKVASLMVAHAVPV